MIDKNNTYKISHYSEQLRGQTIYERKKITEDLLAKYKYAKKIITTKLHCFLPCRAMGVDVEYRGPLDERTADLVTSNPDTTLLEQQISKILLKE